MIQLKEKRTKRYHFEDLKEFFQAHSDMEIQNEKHFRIQEFMKNLDQRNIVEQYKEQVILEEVKKFEKEFESINPQRTLFLYPKNEFGGQKYLPTFVKPTLLEENMFSHYLNCIQFFSNLIEYEELEHFNLPPKYVASPFSLLQWKKGDSLDISLLIESFLLGAGYNAYVIMGIASKIITCRDENELKCPLPLDHNSEQIKLRKDNDIHEKENNEFYVGRPQEIQSDIDQLKITEQLLKKRIKIQALAIDDDEPERGLEDIHQGQRIHFWIMLKEQEEKNISQTIMIDPVSCGIWSLGDSNMPFFRVLQIFNDKIMWVNKMDQLSLSEMRIQDFETDPNWMRILFQENNESQQTISYLINKENQPFDNKEEIMKVHKNILLDRPLSWVPKITFKSDQLKNSMEQKNLTRFYEKMQVDIYPEYSQPDGLIRKITYFTDYKKTLVDKMVFHYKNRQDNLFQRTRYPFEFREIDFYNNNCQLTQPNKHWPQWKEIETINKVKRIIRFHPLRFADGLVQREEYIGQKTVERYQNRDDNMIYQAVRFKKRTEDTNKDTYKYNDSNIGPVVICKMVQKFEKNLISDELQIQKLTIDLVRQKIFIIYHLQDSQISPEQFELTRDAFTGITPTLNHSNQNYNSDKTRQIYSMEKECFSKIKYSEQAIEEDFKNFRVSFEQKIDQLQNNNSQEESDKFGILIKNNYVSKQDKKSDNVDDSDQEFDEFEKKDYIGEILKEKNLMGRKLDVETANQIKQDIIYNHQNRYIERSIIINQRFQTEKENVFNKQKEFQRKTNENIGKQEEEKLEEDLYNFNLKLGILEQRLLTFQKTAYEKYEELQNQLETDPRLNP